MDKHATDKPQGSRLHTDPNTPSSYHAGSNPTSNASADAHGNPAGVSDADPGTHVDTSPDLTTGPNSKPDACAHTDADSCPESHSDASPDSHADASPNSAAGRGWACGARRR